MILLTVTVNSPVKGLTLSMPYSLRTIPQTNGYSSDTACEQATKKLQGVPQNACSGEKPLACTSTFAANMKMFGQQKKNNRSGAGVWQASAM